MGILDEIKSVDPIKFRDDCIDLIDQVQNQAREDGKKPDLLQESAFYFLAKMDPEIGQASEQEYYSSSMRFFALMSLLHANRENLDFLFRHTADESVDEIHIILFEAAAVAPLREGKFDAEDILAEARPRVAHIEALEKLLGAK